MGLSFGTESGKAYLGDLTSGWTVSEYATPTVAGDTSEGTNTATYSGVARPDSVFLVDKKGTITHSAENPESSSLGIITGDVQGVSVNGPTASVSQNSLMTKLNVDRTSGPAVGGSRFSPAWSVLQRNGDYGSYGITSVKMSRDGAFLFIYSRIAASGNQHYLTKINVATGARVWRITVSPTGTWPDSMVVDDLGRVSVMVNERVGGSTGYYAGMNSYSPDGVLLPNNTNIWIVTHYNTTSLFRLPSYKMVSDRVGNIYVGSTGINLAFQTNADSGAAGVLQKLTPGINGVWDAVQSGWLATPRNSTETPGYKAFGVWWLTGDRFLAFGPILPYDPPATRWAIYNTKPWREQNSTGAGGGFDKGMTRALFVDSPYGIEVGVTQQDDDGYFFIGDRQYNADGNQVNSLEGVRRGITDAQGKNAPWQVVNLTGNGQVTFMTQPNYATLGPQSVLQFDTFYSRVTVSQAINQYIALVFGSAPYAYNYASSRNPSIVLPGWSGNALDFIIQLLVAYKLEMVLVDNTFVIRDVGSTVLDVTDLEISPTPSTSVVGNSRTVAVSYTNAKTVSASGRPATTLVNLARNPRAAINTNDLVGVNGTVYKSSGSANFDFARFIVSQPTSTPAPTNDVYAVYGSTIVNGARVGDYKRMGLTPGVTYVVTCRISIYAPLSGSLNVNSRKFGIKLNKANGEAVYFWSRAAPNEMYGSVEDSVTFFFDPAYEDASIIFMAGNAGNGGGQAVYFGPFRITPKGLQSPEFPDNMIIVGGQQGWAWDGVAENSSSHLDLPAIAADNLLYDARADDNRTYSIAINNVETITLTLDTYPTSLNQPYPTNNLAEGYGSYYVSAQDNLPVQAQQWLDYGGSVAVRPGAEANQIDVIITGPVINIPGVPGPYKLSASDGKNDYAFFSITGSGIRTELKELRVNTGVDEDKITRADSGVVDNFAIASLQQAYDAVYALADKMGGASVMYDFIVPISKIARFGSTPGAMFRMADSFYRTVSVRIGNAKATITAERFTTMDQFLAEFPDVTVDQMTALWDGYTVGDMLIKPLRPLT